MSRERGLSGRATCARNGDRIESSVSVDSEGPRLNAPAGHPQIYRFGVFELDTLAHELRKQGARIRLQEQPYQVLLMLLGSAGKVVTREELRQALWPSSVYVDFDHGLNNAIARLREALGDAATTPSFIETVPRLGYRFIYPVVSSAATTAVQHVTNGSLACAGRPARCASVGGERPRFRPRRDPAG